MRLLDTETLDLKEFFTSTVVPSFGVEELHDSGDGGSAIPTYAILSHVWGPEEISFQEMIGKKDLVKSKKGFPKAAALAPYDFWWKKLLPGELPAIIIDPAQARRDGYQYIWIDTCCIDKTSSTELSEAINSMYAWYRDSAVCYVLLADVHIGPVGGRVWHDFYTSRWFTRGWTLQELLALVHIQFFRGDWKPLGTKLELIEDISAVTKIDLYALAGGELSRLSVARRMSWVANRQTTRLEDMAYCLLGIFGINMPLLYGEGMKAFIRLQEEIMKTTDDQSIFAWKDPTAGSYRDDYPEGCNSQGLLAPSPEVFQNSKSVSQFQMETLGSAISTSTNKGLQIEFLMCRDPNYPSELVYMAILRCFIGQFPGHLAGIRLRRLASSGEQYTRVDTLLLFQFTKPGNGFSDFRYASPYDALAHPQLRSFDPIKSQASLLEVDSKVIYNDWKLMSILVKNEPQVPLLSPFWLAMPERFPPTRLDMCDEWFDLSERLKYWNDVRQAYPPQYYDPETRSMQPERSLGQGSKKLGALLVNYKGVNCILILGITYWESTPWCAILRSPSELGNYSSYPRDEDFRHIDYRSEKDGATRDEDFRKKDGWYARLRRDYYAQLSRLAQPQIAALRHAFDNFDVNNVKPPTDTGTKRHRYLCESLDLVSIVEHTTISGREIYLLRLLFKSEEDEENET